MAKYLIKASYSVDGLKGVMTTVEQAVAGVGGSLESFYFAFGGEDVYVTVDVPDNTAAMASVGAPAPSKATLPVVLPSPSEVGKAVNVAIDHAPPGS